MLLAVSLAVVPVLTASILRQAPWAEVAATRITKVMKLNTRRYLR
jgi:hypothetical protein